MTYHFIDHGAYTGQFNMSFDLSLANNCKENEIFFRLYQWHPYALSLGANQSINDVDIEKTKKENIDVVYRPTGGRAILHSEELTYSVVFPLSFGLSPKEIYQSVSETLINGLLLYDKRLNQTMLETLQPNFGEIVKSNSGSICFASTAKNEVKFSGKKLIGSAQKKMKNVVLQHGSILCGAKHKELINYLKLPGSSKSDLLQAMNQKTTEIETILNEKVDYKRLRNCLTLGFEEHFNIKFDNIAVAESI
ncbi:lipoate-protein ligase a [hydrocarbon metagenome]|uniref:Lipoate-protein ligase a n=1 Tax=hydrocarbon metagenome TaxID=938273 RepID=A0A0W8G0Q9_9ZZZZ